MDPESGIALTSTPGVAPPTEITVHSTEDPKPPLLSASAGEIQQYRKDLEAYSASMLKLYNDTTFISGELLWTDFTSMFCNEGLQQLSLESVTQWRTLLLQRGVYVQTGRGMPRRNALISCIEQSEFRPLAAGTESNDAPSNRTENHVDQPEDSAGALNEQDELRPHPTFRNKVSPSDAVGVTEGTPELTVEGAHDKDRGENHTTTEQYGRTNGLGLSGLSRMCQNRAKYTGALDEDLFGMIQIYTTLAATCKLKPEEMGLGFPMMLDGDALVFFSQHLKVTDDFEKMVRAFEKEFTSEEQRNRLLRIWQKTSLLEAMRNCPDKSQVTVFKEVCRLLASTQRQLHESYHEDRFLRDQIVLSVDIPEIERSLREKAASTSQEATQRIAALLSTDSGSAGTYVVHGGDDNYYGLGTQYGGDAKRKLKRRTQSRHGQQRKPARETPRRKPGCIHTIVCGKDHFARNNHSKQEIFSALKRTRTRTPSRVFTVGDVCDLLDDDGTDDSDESEASDEDSGDQAYAAFCSNVNSGLEVNLSNHAFVAGSYDRFNQEAIAEMEAAFRAAEEEEKMDGLIMDSGANRRSVMSLKNYRRYCRQFRVAANIDETQARTVNGLVGRVTSIGTATIPIPFKDLGIICDVQFNIMNSDIPSLLSLRDIKHYNLDVRLLHNRVDLMGRSQKLVFEDGFLKHKWSPQDFDFAFLTTEELKKLHRSFGHPSVSALSNLLSKARPDEMGPQVKKALQDLVDRCSTCQFYSSKPRRFKLTVGSEDLRFNHTIAADIMYFGRRPVMHVVCEATHFAAARFMNRVSGKEAWKVLRRCWMDTYLGPPDFLRVDQGSNFMSREFKGEAAASGVTVLEAPIESANTMSHVERYHQPLRAAYNKLRASLDSTVRDDEVLQLATTAVNNTVGPEGLCPTLLVYGALPRPARSTSAVTQLQRANAVEAAMKAVEKEHAKSKLQFARRYKGPYGRERLDLAKMMPGSPVLVYRDSSKSWTGPHKFISIEGDTVVVQQPSGRKLFRSTVVKPYRTEDPCNKDTSSAQPRRVNFDDTPGSPVCVLFTADDGDEKDTADPCPELIEDTFDDPDGVFANRDEMRSFEIARTKEIQGLCQRKVFERVKRSDIPAGTRIYKTKWVDLLKKQDDGTFIEKSRLVAQNFRDQGATAIPTHSPTVTRMAQRLMMTSAAVHTSHKMYIRDVSQAYVQSATKLERPVYLEPPKEMNLPDDEVLRAVKPLYGIPESGLHWFATYHAHHMNRLNMEESKADRCLLFRRNEEGSTEGVTVLQVDDSNGHGNENFLADEEEGSKEFQCKPRKIITTGSHSLFNGSTIQKKDRGYRMHQEDKLRNLSVPTTDQELVSTRAAIQYIGGCTRPDLCSCSQLLSTAAAHPTPRTYRQITKIVHWAHDSCDVGLTFVPMEKESLSLVLFTDASFANTDKYASQLGFVLCLVDEHNTANIIHYGSQRCKRVTRSVMAAELYALSYGFDYAFVAKAMAEEIFGQSIPIQGLVDSRTLFNVITKGGATMEKRLQIDAFALRQAHHNGELQTLAWIPSSDNVADALTKELPSPKHALYELMKTNQIHIQPTGWVEHRFTSNTHELESNQT